MLAHNNYPFYHGQQQHHHHHQPQLNNQQQLQLHQEQLRQQQQQQQQDDFDFSTTLDNIPTAAAAFAFTQRYQHRQPATSSSQSVNSMPSNSWMLHGQQTPRQQPQQFGHQRDSSLSSVGSNPPASPYNANTANPQIAVTDAAGDALHDITGAADNNNYTFGMTKPMAMPDNFYANPLGSFHGGHGGGGMNGHNAMGSMATADALPALTGAQQQKQGGLVPSDMSASGLPTRSRPVSVASSIGGDSPATPSFHEHEDEHRRPKNGEGPDSPVLFPLDSDLEYVNDCLHFRFDDIAFVNSANTPKLDRTMTDVYGDELYSPNFTITSASPPPQTHLAMSPPSDLFTQRIQTANLYAAAQSPVSNDSGAQSPFRQGSPYASAINDFSKVGTNRARMESAQQLRERRKAEEDAKQLQRQMARHSQQGLQRRHQQQSTPTTISPKDAVLEFNETDADSTFPLFPAQETNMYGLGQNSVNAEMSRAASQQSASPFQSMSTTPVQSGFNFSMPSNVQLPQQYPFIPRQPQQQQQPQPQQQQQQQRQQQLTPSASTFSRMSSAEASNTDGGSSNNGGPAPRPDRTAADGGTYTCTYHGCTLRFDTPALLQKHKREGHRQVSTLNHLRSPGIIGQTAGSVASSQAGPHRCDRINPSTGKPCSTVFSRPYDLTRHEDTIHNAKKQKVRCGLCTEEKLFSRADALTRHYRVCHPDVEVPGKHRRRGV
ncbi:hypothetical protein GQX73_g7765 [Xylaria multiplex]|uniref:C2H2-type domain-containing protein n=1 Tax=Xylaria multiplex TaxID=323545 RepID=A0A7C8IN47_9PEZI|nr:hypothetical protein GQX73_g7765 [Xylaria multiplex]